MFRNIRIFTLLTAVVVIAIILISSFIVRSSILNSQIVPAIEQPLAKIVDTYNKFVWSRYFVVMAFLEDRNRAEWTAYPQFNYFVDESNSILLLSDLVKAEISSNAGNLFFTTNPNIEVVSKRNMFGLDSLQQIYSNKDRNIYILDAKVKSSGDDRDMTLMKIEYPLLPHNADKTLDSTAAKANAKIEFYIDLTQFLERFRMLQITVTVFLSIMICIACAAIIIFSRKVEDLIVKQQEVSAELTSAKMIAESESRSKSQFLANVSHELRTPLNAIIGFSEIISSESMGPVGNAQYKEFINDIHASGVHLLSLINDILDYSKAEENKFVIDFEQVDITKIIKLCLRMVAPRAESNGVTLKETVPPEHVIILADQKRVKQVVLNLLTNAIKFTTAQGVVEVVVEKNSDNNTIVLQIKDSGVGMAPQDLARALSPFGQVENQISKKVEGTGLGLPLTKKLVELMKGKFDIKSELGIGTTVIITFSYNSNEIEENKQQQLPA